MDTGREVRGLVPPLLWDRVFRRYWCASTVSMFGDQVSSVALPLTAVLVLHAHAEQMGYLTALQWLPSLLFGLHAGTWADRLGRRRHIMIAADAGRALLLTTIPLCFAARLLSLEQLYAVTFAVGTLSILFNVSDGTLFVSITKPPDYVDGQSLLYVSRALSFVGGPALGGPLVQFLSAPFALVADALSFLGSAFFLNRIRPAEPPADHEGGKTTAGLLFVVRSGIVRAALLGVAVTNFFHMMFSALFLLYAVRVLHVRSDVLGIVLGVGAFGGFLGSVLTKRVTRRIGVGWTCVAGCLLFTAPLALVPLAAGAPADAALALLAAEFISGFGVMLLDISVGSIFATVIPGAVRSRVTGAFLAINYGARPPGALLGGVLGTMLGLRAALWIAVCGGVCGALLLLYSPLPRLRLCSGCPADGRIRTECPGGQPRGKTGRCECPPPDPDPDPDPLPAPLPDPHPAPAPPPVSAQVPDPHPHPAPVSAPDPVSVSAPDPVSVSVSVSDPAPLPDHASPPGIPPRTPQAAVPPGRLPPTDPPGRSGSARRPPGPRTPVLPDLSGRRRVQSLFMESPLPAYGEPLPAAAGAARGLRRKRPVS